MKTGLFAGSFDPFTIGHMSIVRRALPLFDRLIIGIGVNETKQCMMTPMQRKEAIERIFEGDDRVSVMTYSGLRQTSHAPWSGIHSEGGAQRERLRG